MVLIGAVHDFSSLTASVRHGARSIAEIAREHLGPRAGARDDGVHLDRAGLRHRRVLGHHRGDASSPAPRSCSRARPPSTRAARWRRRASCTSLLAVVLGLVQRFLKPPLWLVTVIFVPGDLRARRGSARKLSHAAASSTRRTWAPAHPRLLLRRVGGAGVVAAPAARLPRRLRALQRARARRHRRLLRRLRDPAADAFKSLRRRRHDRLALPVPLRHHRLRRLLGLPRAGLLGHDLEADRARVAHAPDRLRRDAGRGLRRADRAGDGDDRGARRDSRAWRRAPSTATASASS